MRQRWKNAIRDAVMISVGIVFGLWVTGFSPIKLSCPSVKPSITPPSVLPVVVKKEPPSHSPTSRDVTSATQSSLKSGTSMRQHNNEYDKKIKRPKYVKDEFNLRQPLYVGVVTATEFLNTRATVVNNTWGKKASKIEFFAAEGQGKHPLPIVSLPGVDDTYPPQKKVYRMLGYMHDNYIDQYSWFLRADDDAYIRVPELLNFLSKFDPSEPLYIGAPGFGKGIDLERIKLYSHEHYCMGGPGVIFSRALLIQLAPHLDDCLENVVVSWNEDLEVGRCVSRKLDVQCTWSYEVKQSLILLLIILILDG